MATPNRNQHWVPQFYLRYFTTPESRDTDRPRVWAFPVREGLEFVSNPRNVAANRDLYSFCPAELDSRLQDLESMLGRHWPKLTEQRYPLDLSFRRAIGLFIATLHLRHPSQLARQRQLHAKLLTSIQECPADEAGIRRIALGGTGDKKYRVYSHDLASAQSKTDDDIQMDWGKLILSESGRIAQRLTELPWTALVSDSEAFVTSDNPIVLSNLANKSTPILHPQTRIIFPLSPKKLVVINQRADTDGKIVQVLKGKEAVFNYQIFGSAYRHVFSAWDPIHLLRQVVKLGDRMRAQARSELDEILRTSHADLGRNSPCYCGSQRKFKHCCGRRTGASIQRRD